MTQTAFRFNVFLAFLNFFRPPIKKRYFPGVLSSQANPKPTNVCEKKYLQAALADSFPADEEVE